MEAVDPATLRRGDEFIWANEQTRRYMGVDSAYDDAAGVLVFHRVGEFDSDGTRLVFFHYEDDPSGEGYLWYDPRQHHVLRVSGHGQDMRLKCQHCGRRLGQHKAETLHCPDLSGEYLSSHFYPEVTVEDFFASLGL